MLMHSLADIPSHEGCKSTEDRRSSLLVRGIESMVVEMYQGIVPSGNAASAVE
jgi:hypothetical protein